MLYELSVPFGLDLNNRINVAKSATRMTVSLKHVSNDDIRELEAAAQIWLADNIPSFNTTGSGLSVIFSHFSKRNIDSMLGGTAIALILISFILIVALRSFKVGFLSLIPNLFPAAMGFGLWWYLFHEVGVAISVVAAMTLGIVVDDTVHFLSKYLRARRENNASSEEAVVYAFKNVGFALIVTTIALVGGFTVLAMSGFKVNSDMAKLTAITIAFALAVDLTFLPSLLMYLDREKKSSSKNTTNRSNAS